MKINAKPFGVLSDGSDVTLYVLEAGDIALSITDFGAAWTSLLVPGKTGRDDLLLGFSSLEGYFHCPFFGATIGRFANRIGGAAFTLEGKTFGLCKNDGPNTLHGGRRGYGRRLWKAEPYRDRRGVFVRFELESAGGDEGFPGRLRAEVTYGLNGSNELSASYRAWVDAPCPVNLTNHAYFNLAGEGSGDILSHELKLHASSYVEPGPDLIPTGKLIPVPGTPFDFTARKPVARDYAALCGGDTAAAGKGYDHCFVIDGYAPDGALRPCAEVFDPSSGRSLAVSTTQPGVQFYSGNFLDGIQGKTGSVYNKNAGFCLETQHFPDSPNQSGFPSAVFGPGRDYRERAVFSFAW